MRNERYRYGLLLLLLLLLCTYDTIPVILLCRNTNGSSVVRSGNRGSNMFNLTRGAITFKFHWHKALT